MLGLQEGRMEGKNEYRFSLTGRPGATIPGHTFSSYHILYSVLSRYLLHVFSILLGYLGQL
jgi:hypothetical protein